LANSRIFSADTTALILTQVLTNLARGSVYEVMTALSVVPRRSPRFSGQRVNAPHQRAHEPLDMPADWSVVGGR